MELLYIPEHTACHNYISDIKVGFMCPDLKKGEYFEKQNKPENHLIFILSGSVNVSCNEYRNRVFKAGEIIFLPKMSDCEGSILEDSSMVILAYSNQVSLCDKKALQALSPYCQDIKYNFRPLDIREPLTTYLNLLRSYLQAGMNCSHLHEIKQIELFLIFRGYYTKEENAQLFYPIIGKSLDFRSMVMEHYLSVRNSTELASKCGYSVSAFATKFREEFDDTPYGWMQKQIARHVKGKLLQAEVPLKSIADEFNFSSLEHLIKFCKANLGGTPTQIRHDTAH
ncbi:MAG: helix-turn-helix domain-containing protein [Rikenellaceae bacterium]